MRGEYPAGPFARRRPPRPGGRTPPRPWRRKRHAHCTWRWSSRDTLVLLVVANLAEDQRGGEPKMVLTLSFRGSRDCGSDFFVAFAALNDVRLPPLPARSAQSVRESPPPSAWRI